MVGLATAGESPTHSALNAQSRQCIVGNARQLWLIEAPPPSTSMILSAVPLSPCLQSAWTWPPNTQVLNLRSGVGHVGSVGMSMAVT